MTQRVRWSFSSDHDATGEVIATALSTSNRFYALIKLDAGGFATEEFANLCSVEDDELPIDAATAMHMLEENERSRRERPSTVTLSETSQEIALHADAVEAVTEKPPKKKRSLLERSDPKQGDSK